MSNCVWLIILNWNGADDTVECVKSCLTIDYEPYQILIVDNHSDDASVEIFRRRFPNVPLIISEENIGYAGGNNLGIRYAIERGAEYVMLINNDVVVEPTVLSNLIDGIHRVPRATMAAPKVLYYDAPAVINSMGTSMDWFKLRPYLGACNELDQGQYKRIEKKDVLVGCALMVRCNVIDEIGLIDEKYFLIQEEADWCLRNRRHGYENIVVPEAVVYHKCSRSIRHFPELTHYYNIRNFLYLACKNAGSIDRLKVWFGFMFLSLKNLLRIVLGSYKERRMARVFFDASYDYFRSNMGKCARSY